MIVILGIIIKKKRVLNFLFKLKSLRKFLIIKNKIQNIT
jgi:hypothetical protein